MFKHLAFGLSLIFATTMLAEAQPLAGNEVIRTVGSPRNTLMVSDIASFALSNLNNPLSALSRLVGVAAINNPRATSAMSAPTWAVSTVYGNGYVVVDGGNYYEQQAGVTCTSAAAGGGPTGTGAVIADNTCSWAFKPGAVVANSSAPTITPATTWAVNIAYPAGAFAVTFTGSGATAVGNFYVNTGACTSAAAGGGPVGTGSGIVDNTCTWNFSQSVPTAIFSASSSHSYLWNGGSGSAVTNVRYYGGTPTTSAGTQYEQTLANTVSGVKSQTFARYEFVTTSSKFVIRSFEISGNSAWRLAVCSSVGSNCQYVSASPYGMGPTGWGLTIVDFSAVSGHEPRTIILEGIGSAGSFGGIDVLPTEDVYLPGGSRALSMAVTGDSYPAGGGVTSPFYSFPATAADLLGIRNTISAAIGGCGYIVSCTSGTAISRITDVATANNGSCPDILLQANGTNDVAGSTPAQIVAAQTAYLTAIRNLCPTTMPIFVMGIWAHNNGGTAYVAGVAAETAMQAAIVARGDPWVFFVPVLTDAQGSWQTGTGTVGATNGTGNSDWTVEATNLHLNAVGNRMFGERLGDFVRRTLNAGSY